MTGMFEITSKEDASLSLENMRKNLQKTMETET